MHYKSLLVVAVVAATAGLLPRFASPASASSPAPSIKSLSPTQGPVGTTVTIEGADLADATRVSFGPTVATIVADSSTELQVLVPSRATTTRLKVATPGGHATSRHAFVVTAPLGGVVSLASGGKSSCAIRGSGGVDCWGQGMEGQLGDGKLSSQSPASRDRSAFAQGVVGVGDSGTLGGVVTLVSDGTYGGSFGYCALLETGGVDCWGSGEEGQLGDGQQGENANSAVPVAALGVGGIGILDNVVSLVSDGFGFCAVVSSGGVDCWGTYPGDGDVTSDVPVAVVGVDGTGTLGGVVSVVSTGEDFGTYCALLTSSGVDCWGYGFYGQLGDGIYYTSGGLASLVPVEVLGVGGTGTLTGVVSLAVNTAGFCAVLTSDGVDCWGDGYFGELGDGVAESESAVPVEVLGVGGTGTLTGVVSLTSDSFYHASSYCAQLTSGGVDCWGAGRYGELGDGVHYKTGYEGSAVPVAVVGVGDSGTLGGVASLATDANGFCSVLTSGGVDCWGAGYRGQLGDGAQGSAVPVAVVGVGDSGTLGGVVSLAGSGSGYFDIGFCAVLTSGGVDCWGLDNEGQLGDGVVLPRNRGSAVPVTVVTKVVNAAPR